MPETGFLNRVVKVAGKRYRYQVYLPASFTLDRSWPITLFLHGVGECGRDGLLPTEVGLGRAIRRKAERFPMIVVFPQAPPKSSGWRGDTAVAAVRALDHVIAEFNGDSRRLYLTGLSMGGSGTLRIAATNPGRFAALVPVSPDFDGELSRPADTGAALADPYLTLAAAVGPTPIWIFQGCEDTTPRPSETRRLTRALERYSTDLRYTEYPRIGHNAWDQAYAEPRLVPWLLAHRRAPSPLAQ